MISVFSFLDYKKYLRAEIAERKQKTGPLKVTFSDVAASAKIHQTYLSRVLAGQADINSDQAFAIATFLGLGHKEAEYFLLLVENQKSSNQARKKILLEKINRLKDQSLKTKAHLQSHFLSPSVEKTSLYYTDPIHQVVHMALTIPEVAQDPERLRLCLCLSVKRFQIILKNLEEYGFLRSTGSTYESLQSSLHLDPASPVNDTYQQMMRSLALGRFPLIEEKEKNLVSVMITIDEEHKSKIREEFMFFLKKVEGIVKDSPAKELYQMNFDLLKWM